MKLWNDYNDATHNYATNSIGLKQDLQTRQDVELYNSQHCHSSISNRDP